MASLSITPAAPTAKVSACRFDLSAVESNDSTTYNINNFPTEDAVSYRIVCSLAGQDDLVSHEFSTSSADLHTWPNVVFPAAGNWAIALVDQRDDSETVLDASFTVA